MNFGTLEQHATAGRMSNSPRQSGKSTPTRTIKKKKKGKSGGKLGL